MSKSITHSSVKFGKVFVRAPEKVDFAQLKSAYFSNGDLKIYDDSKRQLHPEYENLKGATISLGFQIKCPDLLQGEIVEINGKFKFPLKLGEYPEPDLENLGKALEEEKRYCKELCLLPEDKADEIVETSKVSAFFLFCSPGRPILDQTLLLKACPQVMMDDILESFENDMGERRRKSLEMPYKLLSELAQFGHDFVMAEESTMTTVSCAMNLTAIASQEESLSKFRTMDLVKPGCTLLDYAIDFKEEVVKLGGKHGLVPERMINFFDQSMKATVLEFSKEWRELEVASMVPTVVKVRQEAMGGVLITEMIAYQNGIGLSERIRQNIIFRILIDNLGKATKKLNDIMSYSKEMEGKREAGCYNNEVYLLQECKKLPVSHVIEKLVNEVNESTEQMEKLGQLLLKLFPDEDEEHDQLRAYLKMVKEVVVGFILWHGFVKRYHEDLVFDCYIDQ